MKQSIFLLLKYSKDFISRCGNLFCIKRNIHLFRFTLCSFSLYFNSFYSNGPKFSSHFSLEAFSSLQQGSFTADGSVWHPAQQNTFMKITGKLRRPAESLTVNKPCRIAEKTPVVVDACDEPGGEQQRMALVNMAPPSLMNSMVGWFTS